MALKRAQTFIQNQFQMQKVWDSHGIL